MTFANLYTGLKLALDSVPPHKARQEFDVKTSGALLKHEMWGVKIDGLINTPRSADGVYMAATHRLELIVHHANRPLRHEASVLDAIEDYERTLLALYSSEPFNTGFVITLTNWGGPVITSDGDYLRGSLVITALDRYDLTVAPT